MAVFTGLILILLPFIILCNAADTDSMKNNIKWRFSAIRHHSTNPENKKLAKEFIHDEFKRLGLTTQYHAFWDDRYQNVQFSNVVGWLQGEKFGTADDHIIGVGAHYDTAENSPGVDDNGSGVSAMLEVVAQVSAAVKRGSKITNTIMFGAFDAGVITDDHFGSIYFTQNWLKPWLKHHYVNEGKDLVAHGIIIMDSVMDYSNKENSQTFPAGEMTKFQSYFFDTIQDISNDGFRGNFLMVAYREPEDTDNNLAVAFKSSWESSGRPEYKIQSFPLRGQTSVDFTTSPSTYFINSDHTALWAGGIPAIYITDSGKLRGEMIKCFHQSCDNLDKLITEDNIKFLGKVADAVATTVINLAGSDKAPVTKSPDPQTTPRNQKSGCCSVSVISSWHFSLLILLAVVTTW